MALTDLSDTELEQLIGELGGKPFQARQLSHWLYKHQARDYAECQNLPTRLKSALAERGPLLHSKVVARSESSDGTCKLLLELADGETIESVLIPEAQRNTLCISTQVGCPVGCVFCASGLDGVRRNLSAGEIVEQVLHATRESAGKLTNLVVMGIGEPMLNLDNLLQALRRIHDPESLNMGARRITVSTSGHPDKIARFAAEPLAFNLAISLHAGDDELRARLVPHSKASAGEMIEAGRAYFAATKRQVTFEVVLLAGVNDRRQDAAALIRRIGRFPCTVNLLPWNPVQQIPHLRRPAPDRVEHFAQQLRDGGLNVTLRKQRGADKSAACGQLRIQHQDF